MGDRRLKRREECSINDEEKSGGEQVEFDPTGIYEGGGEMQESGGSSSSRLSGTQLYSFGKGIRVGMYSLYMCWSVSGIDFMESEWASLAPDKA